MSETIVYVEIDEASENVGEDGRDEGRLKERLKELLRGSWSSSGVGGVPWWGSEFECGVVVRALTAG